MEKRPTHGPELERIAEIVRSGSGRSRLYRWFRRNHDWFAELLDGERPDWAELAAEFASGGLTGADGRRLSPEACRHTWWRCRRAVAKARSSRAKPAVAVVSPSTPSSVPEVAVAAVPQPDGRDALARLRAEMLARSGRS